MNYVHIKTGHIYRFDQTVINEADNKPMVSYVGLYSETTWIRSAAEFFDGRFEPWHGREDHATLLGEDGSMDDAFDEVDAPGGWDEEGDDGELDDDEDEDDFDGHFTDPLNEDPNPRMDSRPQPATLQEG